MDYVQSFIATVMHSCGFDRRLGTFASLCGLVDSDFNPAAKAQVYVRTLERIQKIKCLECHTDTLNNGHHHPPSTTTTSPLSSSLTEQVFRPGGLSKSTMEWIIEDLFAYDPYWKFDYLQAPCDELEVSWCVFIGSSCI